MDCKWGRGNVTVSSSLPQRLVLQARRKQARVCFCSTFFEGDHIISFIGGGVALAKEQD